MTIRIHPEIFELAPGFNRGLVIAEGLGNSGASPALEALLAETLATIEIAGELKDVPSVATWDEAHRAFGSNPNKFPPAHKNLLKRASRPDFRLPFISPVVAIMNIVSLRLRTPVGGDDVDRALAFGEHLELRRAGGGETFVPLGKDAGEEQPEPGEVIYVVGQTVMCRRWNWRNSCQTLIAADTRRIVMNVDLLGPDAAQTAQQGAAMVAELLQTHCGATTSVQLLNAGRPEVGLAGG